MPTHPTDEPNVIPGRHRRDNTGTGRRPARRGRFATVWPCAQDTAPHGTGILAGWLLHAVIKVVTTYSMPGNRVLLLPAPWHGAMPIEHSVWPTGQQGRSAQLRDRGYVPETDKDTRGMSPAVAACVIARYSQPGSVVVDPDCGAGVVVIEAVRAGRHAVGMTHHPRWWRVARVNVTAAKHGGAWHDATILDTATARPVRDVALVASADLVLTAIRLPTLLDSLNPDSDCLAGLRASASLLRPGGHAVVVLRPHRTPDGNLLDLTSLVSRIATAHGLIPVDRCIALTGQLRGNRIIARASTADRDTADHARLTGTPIGLVTHRTIVIFHAPDTHVMSTRNCEYDYSRSDYPK